MAEAWSKLMHSITASTIWSEPHTTRIVWITLLAMSDRDGYVGASIPGLAAIARVTVEEAEIAIKSLLSPDRYSRNKNNDGRRIEETSRGWIILNYPAFRDERDAEIRREYERNRKAQQRAKTKMSGTHRDKMGQNGTNANCPEKLGQSAHVDVDVDVDQDPDLLQSPDPAQIRKVKQVTTTVGAEPLRVTTSTELFSEPPVIEIPILGGSSYPVTQSEIDEWSDAYPAVDVLQVLRNLRQWNLSNPIKQKTPRGVRKHITGALAREQDKGRGVHGNLPQRYSPNGASFDALAAHRENNERIRAREAASVRSAGPEPPVKRTPMPQVLRDILGRSG